MALSLPRLPYALDALEPHMSRETLEFHHGKHHQKYIDTANELIEGTDLAALSLDEMVQRATGKTFDNVAQAWNHDFFWKCLTPDAQEPSAELAGALERAFGGIEKFRDEFTQAAAGLFGSGWTWLVMNDNGSLEVTTTKDGDTPITDGRLALLACDVWEHAYYIDYRNDRAKYLEHFWPLVNWDFVGKNLSSDAPHARAPSRPGRAEQPHGRRH